MNDDIKAFRFAAKHYIAHYAKFWWSLLKVHALQFAAILGVAALMHLIDYYHEDVFEFKMSHLVYSSLGFFFSSFVLNYGKRYDEAHGDVFDYINKKIDSELKGVNENDTEES